MLKSLTVFATVSLALLTICFAPSVSNAGDFAVPVVGTPDTVRICTWNLHNYNVARRNVNGKWRVHPKPESERDAICDVLAKINPDILLVQEIGDSGFMNDFRARLEKRGLRFAFCAVGEHKVSSRLGILSKIKPEKVFDFSDAQFEMDGIQKASPRGTLGFKFKGASKEWFVFCVHLKSKFGAKKADGEFAALRYAEASALCSRIRGVCPDSSPLIVGGDMNDVPENSKLIEAFAMNFLRPLPQRDSSGADFTYLWAKKNLRFKYDLFFVNYSASNILDGITAVVFDGENRSECDHRPVYIDFPMPR